MSASAERIRRLIADPLSLLVWLVVGWAGGLTAAYLHYPEYRGHALDWVLIGWARGGMPTCLMLLTIQFAWRFVRRDAVGFVVRALMGSGGYTVFMMTGVCLGVGRDPQPVHGDAGRWIAGLGVVARRAAAAG